MILADNDTIKTYVSKGQWGDDNERYTLAGLLAQQADQRPEQLAVCDDPRLFDWSKSEPRQLTWHNLHQEVETLALFFRGLGLADDAVIGTYGANTVDFFATVLAIHRAGFIAAPLPLHWREHELETYCRETEISVLIAADRVEDDEPALRIRDLSKDLFDVKYVFGLGTELPDGVLNVGEIVKSIDKMADTAAPLPLPDPNAVVSIHPADLDWNKAEYVVPRSSNQWLALERSCFGKQTAEAFQTFNPYALSGLTGFVGSIVQGVKYGNTTQLHHYHCENRLKQALKQSNLSRALLPGSFSNKLANVTDKGKPQVCLVWKNHEAATKPAPVSLDDYSILDLTVLNNVGAIGQLRDKGTLSPAHLPLDAENADVCLSIKGSSGNAQDVKTGGELILSGPAITAGLFPTNNEHRALMRLRNKEKTQITTTHLACRFTDMSKLFVEPIGFLPDCFSHFGQCILREDLEKALRSIEGIEDLALLHDPMEDKLNLAIVIERGKAMTVATFHHHLKQKNMSLTKHPDIIIEVDKIEVGPTGSVDMRALQDAFEGNTTSSYAIEKKIELLKTA